MMIFAKSFMLQGLKRGIAVKQKIIGRFYVHVDKWIAEIKNEQNDLSTFRLG